MLCKTSFLEEDARSAAAGEEIWALWYRQTVTQERTGRRDAPWHLKKYQSACARSRQRRLSWLPWLSWTSSEPPARG